MESIIRIAEVSSGFSNFPNNFFLAPDGRDSRFADCAYTIHRAELPDGYRMGEDNLGEPCLIDGDGDLYSEVFPYFAHAFIARTTYLRDSKEKIVLLKKIKRMRAINHVY